MRRVHVPQRVCVWHPSCAAYGIPWLDPDTVRSVCQRLDPAQHSVHAALRQTPGYGWLRTSLPVRYFLSFRLWPDHDPGSSHRRRRRLDCCVDPGPLRIHEGLRCHARFCGLSILRTRTGLKVHERPVDRRLRDGKLRWSYLRVDVECQGRNLLGTSFAEHDHGCPRHRKHHTCTDCPLEHDQRHRRYWRHTPVFGYNCGFREKDFPRTPGQEATARKGAPRWTAGDPRDRPGAF
mmetsp:Transcript_5946/g.11143  ORF Transcript_5946/g.11143 Transcript_5946/m.11143 type:complete len:235 (+) Transcript_5946:944-1648(+)